METKFVFNGQEYSSVEEMPPEARQAYEQAMGVFADKNQNGVPDIMEGGAPAQASSSFSVVNVNGQTFSSLDQLPPEARRAYEQAMSMLANRNSMALPGREVYEQALKMLSDFNLMTPEARQAYEQAMRVWADNNQNGIPDIMEGTPGAQAQWVQPGQLAQPMIAQQAQPAQPMIVRQPALPASPSTVGGEVDAAGRNLKLLIFAVAGLLVLAAVFGVLALILFSRLF